MLELEHFLAPSDVRNEFVQTLTINCNRKNCIILLKDIETDLKVIYSTVAYSRVIGREQLKKVAGSLFAITNVWKTYAIKKKLITK